MIAKDKVAECPLAIDIYDHFDLLDDESSELCTGCGKNIKEQRFKDSESFERYKRYGVCQACQNATFNTAKGGA